MIGFVNVNKPSGMSSAKVVAILKKQFHLDKIGHMGTLDPLAEGVLPIAVGKATRMFDYFLEKQKTYIAEFAFGYTSDTLDLDSNNFTCTDKIPTSSEIKSALPKFIGTISQLPPQYSAKKINGTTAYRLARQGKDFELQPKQVEITEFQLLKEVGDNVYQFKITCSSGTYIRSLARDLAKEVDSLAIMTHLTRIKSGFFTIENSVNLSDLENETSLKDYLIPVDMVFNSISTIELNDNEAKKLLNGVKIEKNISDNMYFVKYKNELLGLAKVKNNILNLVTYLRG